MINLHEILQAGITHHQAGRLPHAEKCYREVLAHDPRQPDSWSLLGMLALQVGNPAVGVNCILQAIEFGSKNAGTYNNLGEAYRLSGKVDEARTAFNQALVYDPNMVEVHNNLANLFKSQGDLDGAIQHYLHAIQIKPDYAEAFNNLGTAFQQRGQRAEAEQCYARSQQLNPNNPEVYFNLALMRQEQAKSDECEQLFLRAIQLRPNYPEAHNQLGVVYYLMGKPDRAIASFQEAIRLRPNYAEVYNNLGMMHYSQGRKAEARPLYEQSLRLKPNDPEALNNYATLLNEAGQSEEAIKLYERALELKPNFAQVHNNLGLVYYNRDVPELAKKHLSMAITLQPDYADAHNHLGAYYLGQGEYALAQAAFEESLKHSPNNPDTRNNFGNLLLAMGDAVAASEQYHKALEARPSFALAHSNYLMCEVYSPTATLERIARLHAEWNAQHAQQFKREWKPWPNTPDPERRLRLGFVSADLGRHPIGHLLVELLPRLDREQYEVFCYFNRAARDLMTKRLMGLTSGWLDVHGLSDEQLATRIRADQIDLLFDLSGQTAKNRLLTFARKPAPVQITWMGYPATTGVEAIDYLISDHYSIPPEHDRWFSEKIVRLPEGMSLHELPEGIPDVNPLPALTKGYITFSSFNNPAKVSPEVIALWSRVMHRLPTSRLVMKFLGLQDEHVQRRYRTMFAENGIDTSRVEFRGRTSLQEMLLDYHAIDIALDPFPYTGGTSTLLAVCMGVPVITWPGETFSSRQSYTCLMNLEFTETIARDPEDYVERAAALANNLPHLAELRAGLRAKFLASSYGDPDRFLKSFLPAIRDLWRRWCAEQRAK